MEIDLNKTGGEFDKCAVCGDDGDNTKCYKVKGTNKFICQSCEYKLKDAKNIIKEIENKY